VTKLSPTGAGLVYSTYLGGSGPQGDMPHGIALDASGNAYVTGTTASADFPLHGALQTLPSGAFLTKLGPSGSAFVYSTYLGGASIESAEGVAVDTSGNAYVAGYTTSTSFPTVGPFQATNAGSNDGVVTKVNASGNAIVYSTYLGGSGDDRIHGIAVGADGSAVVTGRTNSSDFPTQSPIQPANAAAGTFDDAFVSKLAPAGNALVYSTYLGGTADDIGVAIALDPIGNAYVTGQTTATDFPTRNPVQPSNGGGAGDAFVSKLDAAGSALLHSTFVGGSGFDQSTGIAVDAKGTAYVAGETTSTNFPIQSPLQATNAGGNDAFVVALGDPELSPASACTKHGECASLHCVDGTCCDTPCTDQCAACDGVGHEGTCTVVTGAPHGSRAACPQTGPGPCGSSTCAGMVTEICTFPDAATLCGSACSAGVETDDNCDGKGTCVVGAAHACNDLACADATQCKESCTGNDDCLSGFTCAPDGSCQPGSVCVDDHTSKDASAAHECAPFRCNVVAGVCAAECKGIDDCTSPNVCDPSGHCIPPPSVRDAGCGCEMSGNTECPWGGMVVAIAALCVCAARRETGLSRTRRRLLRSAASGLGGADVLGTREVEHVAGGPVFAVLAVVPAHSIATEPAQATILMEEGRRLQRRSRTDEYDRRGVSSATTASTSAIAAAASVPAETGIAGAIDSIAAASGLPPIPTGL
jgi:hypothetical protein